MGLRFIRGPADEKAYSKVYNDIVGYIVNC